MSPGALLGIGLALAAASGMAPLLLGGQVFQSAIIQVWLPVFGDIKFVTSTIFDIGVYVVVVGLVLDVLRSLGAEIDEHLEEQSGPGAQEPERSQEAGQEPGVARDGQGAGELEQEPDGIPAETTARGHA